MSHNKILIRLRRRPRALPKAFAPAGCSPRGKAFGKALADNPLRFVRLRRTAGGKTRYYWLCLWGSISFAILTSLATIASAGQVTMTTYYPSPFGAYQQLRLVPTGGLTCDTSTEGLLFYDSATDAVKVCNGASFIPLGGVWTQDSVNDYIYPTDTATNPNLNVGIGTTNPGNYSIVVEKTEDASLKLVADSDNNNNGDNPLIFMTQDGGGNAFLIGMTGTAGTDPLESLYTDTTQNAMFIGDPGGGGPTGNLQLGTNNAVRMTIDGSNGNVGIGTTNPNTKLEVGGGILRTSGSGNGIEIFPQDGSGLALQISNPTGDYGAIYGDVSGNQFVLHSNGNIGIGTAAPGAKLDVAGSIKIADGTQGAGRVLTSDASGLASWQTPAGGIPSGAVMFFNLASCPSGWSAVTDAAGRYLVGMPSGGTLGATVGTALTDAENREVGQHTHTIIDPGHTHNLNVECSLSGGGAKCVVRSGGAPTTTTLSSFTSIQSGSTGTVSGTNAPYIQLLVCQKD